jgi:hypothetical protein
MFQIFPVNVYQIGEGNPLNPPIQIGFNLQNVKFRPAPENTFSFSGLRLYSIIEEIPDGLNIHGNKNLTACYAIETVEELYQEYLKYAEAVGF